MRCIHVVPERPLANGSGAQLRAHALGRALSARAEVVTVVAADAFAAAGSRPSRAPSFIETEVPAAVLDAIVDAANPARGDVVLVEGVYLSAVAYRLVGAGVQVILDAHNVESDLLRQTDLARHPVLARLLRRGRWRRAADAERLLLRSVDAVWACSDADAALLRQLAPDGASVHVIPNPVPNWCLAVRDRPRADGINALFVGHLGYRPNIVAALRLAQRIFPLVRRAEPSARLTLAGRAPDRRLRAAVASDACLSLVADPVDLAPLYAGATMALVPLSEGGGTRIKVLEAMTLGLPLIASAKAVEGLAVSPGREFLRAESDAEFAEAAVRLARSPGLRNDLVAFARDFALQRHGPQAVGDAVTVALLHTGGKT